METPNSLLSRSSQYALITKKWRSELVFYQAEIGFLRTLLDGYFFALIHTGEKENVMQISNDLVKLEVDNSQLGRSLDERIKVLELMSEDISQENRVSSEGKQISLENRMSTLVLAYLELKSKIFMLLQKMMAANRQLGQFSYPN